MLVHFFKLMGLKNGALLRSSRPYTGDTFRSYVLAVMSRTRCRCATPVKEGGGVLWRQRGAILINCTNDEYPLQVLILLPLGYEPSALPMS